MRDVRIGHSYSGRRCSAPTRSPAPLTVCSQRCPLLRMRNRNYMVHFNDDDKTAVFIPYVGGVSRFIAKCNEVADNDYEGFVFKSGGKAL